MKSKVRKRGRGWREVIAEWEEGEGVSLAILEGRSEGLKNEVKRDGGW